MWVAPGHFRSPHTDIENDELWSPRFGYAYENIHRALAFLRWVPGHPTAVGRRKLENKAKADGTMQTKIRGPLDPEYPNTATWGSNNQAIIPTFLGEDNFQRQGMIEPDSTKEATIDRNSEVAVAFVKLYGDQFTVFDNPLVPVVTSTCDCPDRRDGAESSTRSRQRSPRCTEGVHQG